MDSYWEERYVSGGASGEGSIGDMRKYKWDIINKYLPNVKEVVDVGCGDLSFWEGMNCFDYIGIDLSSTIIKTNIVKRPEWSFITTSADVYQKGLNKEAVFCLDLLFHIMDDKVFIDILENICRYSSRFIFINTWFQNPFTRTQSLKRVFRDHSARALKYLFQPSDNDGKYQKYRSLELYKNQFTNNGFRLMGRHEYADKLNAMYVFEKTVKL